MSTTENILDYLDDEFPTASVFLQIDTGWREINGERIGGWHVSIAGGPKELNVEAHSCSFIEAVTQALEKSGLRRKGTT